MWRMSHAKDVATCRKRLIGGPRHVLIVVVLRHALSLILRQDWPTQPCGGEGQSLGRAFVRFKAFVRFWGIYFSWSGREASPSNIIPRVAFLGQLPPSKVRSPVGQAKPLSASDLDVG